MAPTWRYPQVLDVGLDSVDMVGQEVVYHPLLTWDVVEVGQQLVCKADSPHRLKLHKNLAGLTLGQEMHQIHP